METQRGEWSDVVGFECGDAVDSVYRNLRPHPHQRSERHSKSIVGKAFRYHEHAARQPKHYATGARDNHIARLARDTASGKQHAIRISGIGRGDGRELVIVALSPA